ncbi:MAG: hypothetical protein K0R48_766 [Gammaproteobacteria bacterium]|jgi:hypothetical protein|nr:hypothetical protein [Gammaproteobacteria bacterium]
MHIVFGNYGDGTIALIQWAHENALDNVSVCNIDTGFASSSDIWQQQLEKGQALALGYGFTVKTLSAVMTWSELALKRKAFFSAQFSGCAGWLKGFAFLDYLDEVDPSCEAVIILPKHVMPARGDVLLQEWESHSPHFGDRRVWQPLYNLAAPGFYGLIRRAGFSPLHHRSLECAPCIHSTAADLSRLTLSDQNRVAILEQSLKQPLFAASAFGGAQGIAAVVEWAESQPLKDKQSEYHIGCGTPFACGE